MVSKFCHTYLSTLRFFLSFVILLLPSFLPAAVIHTQHTRLKVKSEDWKSKRKERTGGKEEEEERRERKNVSFLTNGLLMTIQGETPRTHPCHSTTNPSTDTTMATSPSPTATGNSGNTYTHLHQTLQLFTQPTTSCSLVNWSQFTPLALPGTIRRSILPFALSSHECYLCYLCDFSLFYFSTFLFSR